MPIDVTCHHCFHAFKVADRFAGRKGRCPQPNCGEAIRVPSAATSKAAERLHFQEAPVTRPEGSPTQPTRSRNLLLPVSLGSGTLAVIALLGTFLLSGGTPVPSSEAGVRETSATGAAATTAGTKADPKTQVKRLTAQDLDRHGSFETEIVPFLKTYCLDCHSGALAEAGLQLEQFKTSAAILEHREQWEKIFEYLKIGTMPPSEATVPDETERMKVLAWLDKALYNFDCEAVDDPGRETIQRLNRAEYTNTVRDLFGIRDLDPGRNFPADDVGEGFDNIGDVLTLPPLLMEKYLAAAEEITTKVIIDTDVIPVVRRGGREMKTEGSADRRRGGISFPSRGKATARFDVPAEDEYLLRVRASATQAGDEPAEMGIDIDDVPFTTVKIREHNREKTYEFKITMSQGESNVSVSFLNDFYDPDNENPQRRDRNLMVDWIELEGPLSGMKVNAPEHHQRIVIAEPSENKTVKQAATEVFANFLPRAFRRPVDDAEVVKFAELVERTVEEFDESYEQGIRLGLQAALASPSFLFRIEEDPRPDDPDFKHELNDFELASRLSYFLWSSMPDDELFDLARGDKLSDPQILEQQVKRMLADPKSQALVDNFAGQWLNLRNLDEINFSRRRFRSYNGELRESMKAETFRFFEYVMREDRSILDFIDGDYTFVDERLADHYDIDGVEGDDLQKVSLEGTSRAGVLTQSSILALTSNPTRTSPVKRGKWIMENILGTPPPPPPPNVPELEETAKASPDATLAEQLALHREDPGCASCHDQMDPLGLAFEKFDAIGRFRERDGKHPIDDSGELPGGQKFQGARELIEILRERKELFAKNLTRKMLTYALGRGLEYYDICTVNEIVNGLERDDYKFSRLILGVVNSDPFRYRRGDGGVD
jgi:hypothetical protein